MRSVRTNAVLNVIKQVCAIIFPLITLPYVTRVIGAEGIGKYTFSSSVNNYFVLLAALGINTYAIREGAPIRDSKKEFEQFSSQIFSINIVSSILSYILLAITILTSDKLQSYTPYLLIQSLAIILAALGAEWINSIYEDYLYITIRNISIQIICLLLTFTLVRTSQDLLVYTFIIVFAANGGNIINFFYSRKYCRLKFTIRMNLKQHIKPLLVLFINTIAILVYVNADITMLGFFMNDRAVGIYSFAARIYNVIKGMISAATTVAVPRITYISSKDSEYYKNYVYKIFSALTLVTLPIIVGLITMSQDIIFLVGGEDFLPGNNSLKVLAFAMIFALFSGVITNCILVVNKKETKCMLSTTFTAIINIILNLFLIPRYGIIAAAVTTIIAEALNMAIQLYFASVFVDVKKLLNKDYVGYFVGSAVVYMICTCVSRLFNGVSIKNSIIMIALSFLLSLTAYSIILCIFKNSIYNETRERVMRCFK